ncbi:TPA: molecular chaperone DnaK suppressor DksA [Candidatus Dependentiae bacterium]|nr:molecular chaperone DnaK suppressor DksA [Candidatus Dependentiae bacterium]HCU00988.1 molecular chaperone DnaK suppressor DksA [Candidatus Dependentiae bacterium]
MVQKKLPKAELEKIKKRLLERKSELEKQLTELSTEKISDDAVQDSGDQALSSVMETLRNSLEDSEFAEYKRILKALKSIEEGTYGICIDCSEPISEKRLKYNPHASRCITCQEKFEAGES